ESTTTPLLVVTLISVEGTPLVVISSVFTLVVIQASVPGCSDGAFSAVVLCDVAAVSLAYAANEPMPSATPSIIALRVFIQPAWDERDFSARCSMRADLRINMRASAAREREQGFSAELSQESNCNLPWRTAASWRTAHGAHCAKGAKSTLKNGAHAMPDE